LKKDDLKQLVSFFVGAGGVPIGGVAGGAGAVPGTGAGGEFYIRLILHLTKAKIHVVR